MKFGFNLAYPTQICINNPVFRSATMKQRHTRPASFVLRQGRMTPAQRRDFDTWLPRYALPLGQPVVWSDIFDQDAPVILEIGFGMGDAFVTMAQQHPTWNFVGVEVHMPGVGHCLGQINQAELTNVRIHHGDVFPLFVNEIPSNSLDRIHIFFPDPWPKRRHHKRRLLRPDFLAAVWRVLRPGGVIHLATDHAAYANWARSVLDDYTGFCLLPDAPHSRQSTKFERRGQRLGHDIVDLIYRKEIIS